MSEFINTIDVLGDDAVIDSIIDRSITEFKDNVITSVGRSAFQRCGKLSVVDIPNVTFLDLYAFGDCGALTSITLPKLKNASGYAICSTKVRVADFGLIESLSRSAFGWCYAIVALIIRNTESVCLLDGLFSDNNRFVNGQCYIYVPSTLIDSYKAATNWSTYATQFRAIEDITADGTASGAIGCSGITLDQTALTFDEWKTQTLTATILTPSPFGIDELKWESADPSIAAVSNGVVCPVSKGTTTITATCNGYSATCEVVSNVEGIPMMYQLSEPTTFNGTSDYIDTGVQLFDTAKDFTIICEAEFSKLTNNNCLFHCINEASPWPGLSIDGNSGVRICYTGRSSITTSISNRNDVSALAIRYVDGKMDAIRYRNASGNIVTHTVSGTPIYTKVTQNLLLGAYQEISGTKGRFFNGTISRFGVYLIALSDEQIEAFL